MKKNFLLLFLMALLPLAGWADDLDNAVATFPTDYVYDGTSTRNLPTTATTLKIGDDAVTGDQTITWTNPKGEAATKISVAGDYTYVIVVSGKSGSVTGKMNVAKKNIGVKAKDVTIKYGAAVPTAFEYEYTASDICAADKNTDGTPKFAITGVETLTATTTYTQWANVANYPITPNVLGISADNYAFAPLSTGKVVVAQKSLKDDFADFTVEPIADREFASTSTKQKPALTGDDQELIVKFGDKKLVSTTDYTVTFNTKKDFSGTEDADGFANAGTYYVKITGTGNYKEVLKIDVPYTIKKAPLLIKTIGAGTENTHKYVYGSTPVVPTVNATYVSLQGNKTGDDLAVLDDDLQITLEPADGQADGFAGKYNIVVSGTKSVSEMYTNYTPTYSNQGVFVIEKRPITITAKDKFIAFGAEDNYVAGVTAKAADITVTSTTSLDPIYKAGDAIATYPTLKRAEGNAAGAYDLNIVENTVVIKDNSDPKVDVTANYAITLKKGTFTIESGMISIVPKDVTDAVYGDPDKALDCEILNMRDEDMTDEFVAMVKKALYIEGTDRNVGTKTIKVDKTKIDLGDLAAYYKTDIQAFEANYTIKKRALTKITVDAQTVAKTTGDVDLSGLDQDLVTFEATGYDLTDYDKAALKSKFEFVLKTGTKTNVVAETADAIFIQFKTGITEFANFSLPEGVVLTYNSEGAKTKVAGKYLPGKLTVVAAVDDDITLNPVNKATWTAATETARKGYGQTAIEGADGKTATVKFGSFTMNAEQWYTMVLPFATTVSELADELGYCVVDVLDESSTAEAVKFKLHMQDIPAGQPFLIKLAKSINMADKKMDGTNTAVTFTSKLISKAAANVKSSDGNVEFVGTYTGYQSAADATNEYYMAISNGAWYQAGYTRPTGAYITINSASGARPVFYIEEIDGSTTAIEAVTVADTKMSAEGWYTLGGVKLNAAPTQKGVYIKDGKKFVIK